MILCKSLFTAITTAEKQLKLKAQETKNGFFIFFNLFWLHRRVPAPPWAASQPLEAASDLQHEAASGSQQFLPSKSSHLCQQKISGGA